MADKLAILSPNQILVLRAREPAFEPVSHYGVSESVDFDVQPGGGARERLFGEVGRIYGVRVIDATKVTTHSSNDALRAQSEREDDIES